MPHRTTPRALAIALAASAGVSTPARLRAQQVGQTIPVELAAAYVRTLGRTDSTATVEFLSADIPAAVRDVVPVPPGARIIGSVVANRMTTVLGTSTAPADSVAAWYASEYQKRGFPALSLVRATSPGIGGFRQPAPARPTQFCKGIDAVDIAAVRSPQGWTDFRVRVSPNAPLCRLVPPTPPRPTPKFSLPLPVIYDPPNAGPRPECFTGGAQQQTQTRLFTSMPADSLLRHYGLQLEASGWIRASSDSTTAIGIWTRRDSSGTLQLAKLTVTATLGTAACKNATLEVSTMTGR